jgi:hypothetical protein
VCLQCGCRGRDARCVTRNELGLSFKAADECFDLNED